jgi:plasmid stabilization system protein ParE
VIPVRSISISVDAQRELRRAKTSIFNFFDDIGDEDKGELWMSEFDETYERECVSIMSNPYCHAQCLVLPPEYDDLDIHSFSIKWFTVFYTFDDSSVKIWHVVHSRSDFARLGFRGS